MLTNMTSFMRLQALPFGRSISSEFVFKVGVFGFDLKHTEKHFGSIRWILVPNREEVRSNNSIAHVACPTIIPVSSRFQGYEKWLLEEMIEYIQVTQTNTSIRAMLCCQEKQQWRLFRDCGFQRMVQRKPDTCGQFFWVHRES
jgi:hypothetical protein